MTNTPAPKTSPAFMVQAGLAFSVSVVGMIVGECYLPISPWTRAFLAMGTLFLVSSCFTLAKVVRDQQESGNVISRIDQARLERMLAEYDPFHTPTYNSSSNSNTGSAAYPTYPAGPSAAAPYQPA